MDVPLRIMNWRSLFPRKCPKALKVASILTSDYPIDIGSIGKNLVI